MKKVTLTTTETLNTIQILTIIGNIDGDGAAIKARDHIIDHMHVENDTVEIEFDGNETRFAAWLGIDIYCDFLSEFDTNDAAVHLDYYANIKLKIGGPENE